MQQLAKRGFRNPRHKTLCSIGFDGIPTASAFLTEVPLAASGGHGIRATQSVVASRCRRTISILAFRSDGLRPRRPLTISARPTRIDKRNSTLRANS